MLKNYKAFLEAIQDMNQDLIDKCFNHLNDNGELRDDVIDSMYAIILEYERDLKANIMGNLLKALANDKITIEDYERLLLITQASSIVQYTIFKTNNY